MKIIILGAGSIGSIIGALLSKNSDVLLIGRKEHVEKINSCGLRITNKIKENIKVKAAQNINRIKEDDILFLTTKAQDIKKSLNPIKHLIKKKNIIFILQNGYGNESLVKSIVDCPVIRGITTTAAYLTKPGEVELNSFGKIYIEETRYSKKILRLLEKTRIKAKIDKDIRQRVWSKLFFNCAMNPTTAILNKKNKELLKIKPLIERIIDEIIPIAKKENIDANKQEIMKNIENIITVSGNNISSTLQDIKKGKKTEIDFLNKKIVELGRKHNIKTPINEVLVKLVEYLEKN